MMNTERSRMVGRFIEPVYFIVAVAYDLSFQHLFKFPNGKVCVIWIMSECLYAW